FPEAPLPAVRGWRHHLRQSGSASQCGCNVLSRDSSSLIAIIERQSDFKAGTTQLAVEYPDGPAMVIDDSMHHGQAQSTALTHRFGRKKGIEDLRLFGLGNAWTVIFNP